jgi:hypothetical protein
MEVLVPVSVLHVSCQNEQSSGQSSFLGIILPPKAEVLVHAFMFPAFMPEWRIISTIILFLQMWRLWCWSWWFVLPEWTIVLMLILPWKAEVLAPIFGCHCFHA